MSEVNDDGFTEEGVKAIETVLSVYNSHQAELAKLNTRLSELRREFELAFDRNEISEVFQEADEHNDYCSYDTSAFTDLSNAASKYGLGLSYEDYYLWQPSTASC